MSLVTTILDRVQSEGLQAALEYTRQFDGIDLNPQDVIWDPMAQTVSETVAQESKDAIAYAIRNIRQFHEKTLPATTVVQQAPGLILTERFVPMARAGIYVPNGEYPLISSLLMTAIPAQVAGVHELVVAIAPRGSVARNPLWVYTLQALGIRTVVSLGGAQAIAALGYGIEGLQPVDIIAGPGNRYVAEAKKELFHRNVCGLDLVAGPSEVLIVASPGARADVVALDLLAQAEHAPDASGVLVTWDAELLDAIKAIISAVEMPKNMGQITFKQVQNANDAVHVANRMAPEHLGLIGEDAEALLPRLTTAGAIFVGPKAGQALGDYVAGPSHVLPTGGTGRYLSGLSARTFMRRLSVIQATQTVSDAILNYGATLARIEGLQFHEQSLLARRNAHA